MHTLIKRKTTIVSFLTILGLACFAFLPRTQAVNPPPDGGYPGFNTAEGQNSLSSLTTGSANTAVGWFSLGSLTTHFFNTATGAGALLFNDSDDNTAFGAAALLFNTVGFDNTAVGAAALLHSDGIDNTAIGHLSLQSNTTGGGNTAVGNNTLVNTIGGNLNTALGANAGNGVTTASNVICIGAFGEDVDDSCFIGNIYTNVQPIIGTDPDSVTITSSGRLGRGNVSSRRYKHDIQPMEKASEVLYALKPVSFRYNKEYDATQTLAFGLIAEEVAEVYPDLVGRNSRGEPESVRYEQVNAMLLNEFLKEHRKVQELESTAAKQETTIAELTCTTAEQETAIEDLKSTGAQQQKSFQSQLAKQEKQMEALRSGLQKVSAQLELSKSRPQTVLNNQ